MATAKKEKHRFIVQIDNFTYDKVYRKGQPIMLSDEKTIKRLTDFKIIK